VRISEIDEVRRWSSEELLLRAAWFYYKDELTQDEIAKLLSVSRASVGRLLDRARAFAQSSASPAGCTRSMPFWARCTAASSMCW
jgi:hypothetical protein